MTEAKREADPPLCVRRAIPVILVQSAADVGSQAFCASLATLRQDVLEYPVLGVDSEWSRTVCPAVVQIASPRISFVLVVWKFPGATLPFHDLLTNAAILKVGVSVRADCEKIESVAAGTLRMHGVVDLAAVITSNMLTRGLLRVHNGCCASGRGKRAGSGSSPPECLCPVTVSHCAIGVSPMYE